MGSSAKMIAGPAGQRPGYRHALLLAAGKLAGPVMEAVAEPDGGHDLVDHARSGLRPARSSGRVMFSSAVSVGTRLNAWKTNPTRSRRRAGEVLVVEGREIGVADEHLARGERVEPGDAVHERRLARAGRAHDGGEPAAVEVDGDAVECLDRGFVVAVDLRGVDGAGAGATGAAGRRVGSVVTAAPGGLGVGER